MINAIKHNLAELGFKNNEIKAYIALTQLGEATAAQIAKQADLPRTTMISVLQKLENDNYLTTHKYRGTTYYWIESPKTIAEILANKQKIAGQLDSILTDLYRSESHFPFAKVYDTKTGIKKFIEKTLSELEKNSTIYTIDTPEVGNYQKIYPENIHEILIGIKIKKKVTTHTLVPFDSVKKIAKQKIEPQDIIIRELPQGIEFDGSMWLIKDMLMHFSGNPPFITAIKHKAIVQGMKSIYLFLWNISQIKN